MTDFAGAMQALADRFAGIAGLSRYSYPPDTIEVPAVVVSLPDGEFADYSPVMGQTAADLNLVVNVFVQWGDTADTWQRLLPFTSPSGASSIFAAVMADPTLGGVVDSAMPSRPTNFGSYTWGATPYLGAEMSVEVFM